MKIRLATVLAFAALAALPFLPWCRCAVFVYLGQPGEREASGAPPVDGQDVRPALPPRESSPRRRTRFRSSGRRGAHLLRQQLTRSAGPTSPAPGSLPSSSRLSSGAHLRACGRPQAHLLGMVRRDRAREPRRHRRRRAHWIDLRSLSPVPFVASIAVGSRYLFWTDRTHGRTPSAGPTSTARASTPTSSRDRSGPRPRTWRRTASTSTGPYAASRTCAAAPPVSLRAASAGPTSTAPASTSTSSTTGPPDVRGLAVDFEHIYWANNYRCDYDGMGRTTPSASVARSGPAPSSTVRSTSRCPSSTDPSRSRAVSLPVTERCGPPTKVALSPPPTEPGCLRAASPPLPPPGRRGVRTASRSRRHRGERGRAAVWRAMDPRRLRLVRGHRERRGRCATDQPDVDLRRARCCSPALRPDGHTFSRLRMGRSQRRPGPTRSGAVPRLHGVGDDPGGGGRAAGPLLGPRSDGCPMCTLPDDLQVTPGTPSSSVAYQGDVHPPTPLSTARRSAATFDGWDFRVPPSSAGPSWAARASRAPNSTAADLRGAQLTALRATTPPSLFRERARRTLGRRVHGVQGHGSPAGTGLKPDQPTCFPGCESTPLFPGSRVLLGAVAADRRHQHGATVDFTDREVPRHRR